VSKRHYQRGVLQIIRFPFEALARRKIQSGDEGSFAASKPREIDDACHEVVIKGGRLYEPRITAQLGTALAAINRGQNHSAIQALGVRQNSSPLLLVACVRLLPPACDIN
jgi:hypothetical protein